MAKATAPSTTGRAVQHSKAFKDAARTHGRRPDNGDAFVPDTVVDRPTHIRDDLAQDLTENYLNSATSGEPVSEDVRNAEVPEDFGGPFVETSGREEFADDIDEMNPVDAEPAALPTAIRSRV